MKPNCNTTAQLLLSPREIDISFLLVYNYKRHEMARILNISLDKLENLLLNLFEKFSVKSSIDFVKRVFEYDLLPPQKPRILAITSA